MLAHRTGVTLLLVCLIGAGAASVPSDSGERHIRMGAVAATVGDSFRLVLPVVRDTIAVKLGPRPNGLQVSGNAIVGLPLRPMLMFAALEHDVGVALPDTIWIAVFAAGLPEPALPDEPYQYHDGSRSLPAHLERWRQVRDTVARDSTDAGATLDAVAALGRVLFYDRRLSTNDVVSCASCHLQSTGFSDTARFSRGYSGRQTSRHSMPLANLQLTLSPGFFWDLRAATLEQQVLMPIVDPLEMGMSLPVLLKKLRATAWYPAMFEAAFGSMEITTDRVSRALTAFLRAMVSADSPYDRAFRGAELEPELSRLPPLARQGMRVFKASGCGDCHFGASQMMGEAINSGLDATPKDKGAGNARFRAPSLRNVAVRAPYMHDGRFTSLEEVFDFYAGGVQQSAHLDPRLMERIAGSRRLNLSGADRVALRAFLELLTDSTFLTAPEFSDPFRRRP